MKNETMRILVKGVSQPLDMPDEALPALLSTEMGVPREALLRVRIVRRSLDARKKQSIRFLLNVLAEVSERDGRRLLSRFPTRVEAFHSEPYRLPVCGVEPLFGRVLVVGLGPAGLFAALLLAQAGYRPLVIERGGPVTKRVPLVERYWACGELDEECNVMFGEGGAGTFSDGKLTSRSKDARGDAVLETLVRFGAPLDITTEAKPHIGTDLLRGVVANLRREIEECGGEVRFDTRLDGIETENGTLRAVRLMHNGGCERVPCGALTLAIGQGARDTYRMLFDAGVAMGKKAFAMGVRIEHPQTLINRAQYGAFAEHARLGAAEYRLTGQSGDRGVYTFCMCPGGRVIGSASKAGEVVVNGMSDRARDGENANAAVVVQVRCEDTPDEPLAGLRFQEKLEHAAFRLGGADGSAPAMRVCDLLGGTKPTRFGGVTPTYRPAVVVRDLEEALPSFILQGVKDGVMAFGRLLKGFDDGDAVLTAAETRTSAPLRILRDERMQSISVSGLYPVGEGAGYAGGIVSAAIDGMKAAEAIVSSFAPPSAGA